MPDKLEDPVATAGLSSAEAASRLRRDGFNELPDRERRNVLRILAEVIRQPMALLLLGGGVVYLLLGDRLDALVLLLFASLSVTITIVQESRSERVLASLRNLASPRAQVLRDGQLRHIAGREVVRGDILFMSEGDRVAADATLLTAQDLTLDESLLTGESVPVRKTCLTPGQRSGGLLAEVVPGGDDLPFVFAGTLVARGNGKAQVHATGPRSEIGKIGQALRSIDSEQPHLQRQLSVLVRNFAIVGALAGVLTVLLYGWLRGSWLEAMLGGIAIGMSLLPEEFPLVLAVFMAMGAWRISQVRVLTRRASAIETLGATTVLCTDKTGTLTENRMALVAIQTGTVRWTRQSGAAPGDESAAALETALLACPADATDPMDTAVHRLAEQHLGSVATAFAEQRLLRAYGLQPDLFVMANVFTRGSDGQCTAYAKGAPEAVALLCGVSEQQLAAIRSHADALAHEGIRVLAVARGAVSQSAPLPQSLRELPLEFVGLIGFSDPVRANVPDAVAECRSAGIRVLMITGDYPATAQAIARQSGLKATGIVSGAQMAAMTDAEMATVVRTVDLYARIQPSQKLRIVDSLKRNGEVVAMTGDGVNDAPAIKSAHIGIAMGARGTDVAREASDIVLLDDDFGSIVATIRLGRRIYDNLRKAIEFIVAVHIPIAGLALLPLLLGLPLILTPILIAFLEMVIDPACSVVLEAEREEYDVMRRPPRRPGSPLLEPRRIQWAVLQGAIALALLAGVFLAAAGMDSPDGELRALVFTSLVLVNLGLILVNRTFQSSLRQAFARPNKSLWVLLSGAAVLILVAVYWGPAQLLFRFSHLQWTAVGVCLGAAVLNLLLLETLKAYWFRNSSQSV